VHIHHSKKDLGVGVFGLLEPTLNRDPKTACAVYHLASIVHGRYVCGPQFSAFNYERQVSHRRIVKERERFCFVRTTMVVGKLYQPNDQIVVLAGVAIIKIGGHVISNNLAARALGTSMAWRLLLRFFERPF